MDLGTKLRNYFDEKGLRMDKFAHRLGLSKMQMYQVVGNRVNLPKKCWKKMIELTDGEITLADILKDHLEDIEGIDVESSNNEKVAKVSLKDFNIKK